MDWDADSDGTLMPDSLNEVLFASKATFFFCRKRMKTDWKFRKRKKTNDDS